MMNLVHPFLMLDGSPLIVSIVESYQYSSRESRWFKAASAAQRHFSEGFRVAVGVNGSCGLLGFSKVHDRETRRKTGGANRRQHFRRFHGIQRHDRA